MITLYGISNCDTVRKARKWMELHGVTYTYHDFRSDGLTAETLRKWAKSIGWEALLNRRSQSWKNLGANERASINEESALTLMLANPTLIKRPVVTNDSHIITGFDEDEFNVFVGNTHTSATQGS